MFLWHLKPIPLRKMFSQKICLHKKLLSEGLLWTVPWMHGHSSLNAPALEISLPSNKVQIQVFICQFLHGVVLEACWLVNRGLS